MSPFHYLFMKRSRLIKILNFFAVDFLINSTEIWLVVPYVGVVCVYNFDKTKREIERIKTKISSFIH